MNYSEVNKISAREILGWKLKARGFGLPKDKQSLRQIASDACSRHPITRLPTIDQRDGLLTQLYQIRFGI